MDKMDKIVSSLTQNIDTLWVIDCAILVFIMQAGFMCMESGLSRHKNSINVALKNAADFGVSVVMFWLLGFGIMFGTSYNGIIGTDLFFFKTDVSEYQTYFVFQAMFVATAATIISGAVAERMKFVGYLIVTVLSTGIIYPIIGHWAWSSSYLMKASMSEETKYLIGDTINKGWLSKLGFIDFAGSTIVHSVGGWIALAGVLVLGARIGKYSKANKGKFTGSSFPLAILGTLILWFGWFGFNGGSNGAMDETVPLILINTFLAAAFGLLTGLLISYITKKKPDPMYIVLGPLAGLVAITASCNSVDSVSAIIIGIIGCGVAIFSDLEILNTGLSRIEQFKVQAIGVISIGIFSFTISFIFLKFLNKFYPIRVSPLHEELGLNIAEHGAVSVEHDLIKVLDGQSATGDLNVRGPQDPFTAGGVIGLYYNKMMYKLEKTEAEKNKWRTRISKEVELAVKVQQNFIPKRNLKNYPIKGINVPAREVSGDFFSFYPHNENIYFIIADVAGKGIHAGMVMAKASTLFEVLSQGKVDLDEMAFHMNNDLFNTKTAGMFVTGIIGNYDTISDEIKWVNAGHQPALIRSEKGNFEEFESKSPPLGVIFHKNKSVYATQKRKLNNSRFYSFTDGLSESLDKDEKEIGIEGAKRTINNNYNISLEDELNNISNEIVSNSDNNKLDDDLTVIVIGK